MEYSDGDPANGGVERRGRKTLRLSTNILFYLQYNARHGNSYGTPIWGTRIQSIALCYLQ